MKMKATILILTVFLASMLTFSLPLVTAANTNETWYTDGGYYYDLVAGKNTVVGEIEIDYDGTEVTVLLTMENGWTLAETHIHIADELTGIPQTGSGNPIPGKFEDNQVHSAATTYSFSKDISGMTFPVCIAIHAVVQKNSCRETAWGGACAPSTTGYFPGKNWAIYIIWEPDA